MAAPGAGLAQQDHHSLTFQHSCSVPLVLAPLKNLFIREKTPPHSQQGQGRAVCQQPGHIQLLSAGLGEAGEQAEGFPCKSRMKRVCRRQSCVLLCWQLPSVLSGESRHQPGAESIPCCLHSLHPQGFVCTSLPAFSQPVWVDTPLFPARGQLDMSR